MHRILTTLALCASALCWSASAQTNRNFPSFKIEVHNPLNTPRPSEIVDLPLTQIARYTKAPAASLVAQDHGTGQRLMTQVYSSQVEQAPDRFLILTDLGPNESKVIEIGFDPNPPLQVDKVTARQVPERMDDFAWENDKVAFRVYGPALEKTGEIGSGIDVWSKRVPDFVTTSWFQRDLDSARLHKPELSYHRDNGQGQDSYEVGPSRGDGGTAVWDGSTLIASRNVTTSTILAHGPIRVDFVFHYAKWDAAGAHVDETKRITLDAGSRMNHLRSTFTFTGAPQITVAAGLAIHDGAEVSAKNPGTMISVWDTPQMPSAGRIATGLVLTPGSKAEYKELPVQGKVDGNAVELYTIKSGDTIDYYAGQGWSHGDMPDLATWNADLEDFHNRLAHPVTVKWNIKK